MYCAFDRNEIDVLTACRSGCSLLTRRQVAHIVISSPSPPLPPVHGSLRICFQPMQHRGKGGASARRLPLEKVEHLVSLLPEHAALCVDGVLSDEYVSSVVPPAQRTAISQVRCKIVLLAERDLGVAAMLNSDHEVIVL